MEKIFECIIPTEKKVIYCAPMKALVNEINTFIEVYSDEKYNKEEITDLFSVYQDLNIELIEDNNFKYKFDEAKSDEYSLTFTRPHLQEFITYLFKQNNSFQVDYLLLF